VSRLIRRTATRLARGAGFTDADREDIGQELALEFIQRRADHDAERGSPSAFAAGVVRQRVVDILRERRAHRRGGGKGVLSLHDEVTNGDGGRTERGDALDEADGRRRPGTHSRSDLELCELRLDVEAVLSRLPERLRRLCELLKHMTLAEASRHTGVPRATLYEDLVTLRGIFVASGVAVDFPPADRDPIP
jgi:RNA polymerase sigma-70 factor (ECF subfamily)